MNKRRLVIATFGLINAALIASIGMSLAWYSSGSLLYINDIQITFRGDKEILAGLDEDSDNYKDTIVFNDKDSNKNYFPVSSMFSDEWINAKASKPQFRSEYTVISHNDVDSYTKSELITVDEDGYFSKEMYLYCESNVILTIDSEGTKFTADESANRATANRIPRGGRTVDEVTQDLNDVVKSLRFSVLIPDPDDYHYYIVDPYKGNGKSYLCGIMNYDDDSDEYYDSYYKDGEKFEFFYGEYNDESKIVYDVSNTEDSEVTGRPDKFNAKHQKGVRSVNMTDSIANGFIPKEEGSLTLEEADISTTEGAESGVRIKLKAFIPTKIVLSMYLEGWDKDNTSFVEQGKFNADIKFKIGEESF